MKSVTFSGEISTAFGKPVSPALKFESAFDAYENYAEVPAKEQLTEADMLAVVNESRKAAARALIIAETLKQNGYEKPDPNSPEVARANVIKSLMKAKKIDEATATQIADTLGV